MDEKSIDFPFGPIPHWVKCSEKLPESLECVLGWSINTGCMIAFYDEEFQEWSSQATMEKWKITHWMPLPQPPHD